MQKHKNKKIFADSHLVAPSQNLYTSLDPEMTIYIVFKVEDICKSVEKYYSSDFTKQFETFRLIF